MYRPSKEKHYSEWLDLTIFFTGFSQHPIVEAELEML